MNKKRLTSLICKNKDVFSHSLTVGSLACNFGKHLNMPERDCKYLLTAGLLHDIGKLFIPEKILCKSEKLTIEEYKKVKTHAQIGANYLEANNLNEFSNIAKYHHERWDGAGYFHLKKEELSKDICIITLADSVAAMGENRTYKQAFSINDIFNELDNNSSKQFNPELCLQFQFFLYKFLNDKKVRIA